jgi:ATP-dependent Lon protease
MNEINLDNQNNGNAAAKQIAPPNELVIQSEVLPEVIPILPITQRPVFPGMIIPIIVSGEKMLNTMNEILASDNKTGGVVLAMAHNDDKPVLSDSLYKIGVTVRIIKIVPIDNKTFQVMISALKRFTLVEILQDEPIIKWKVSHYYGDDNAKVKQEFKPYSMAIISSVKELIKSNSLFQEEMKLFLNRFSVEDPGKLADFVASMTSAEAGKIQEILETFDIKKRAEKVLVLLKEEIEMSKLQSKITKQIEQQISKNQKEFFLREQLKQIKQELGLTKDEKATEIEEYEERIRKLKLNDEAKNRINEEMGKIKLLEPRSAEYTVSKNYLDWLTTLPWGIYSEDNYEIKKAKRILDRDHYGLDDIKDRILEFISIGKMKGNISGSILCFIGPPGVGKTSIGKSVAEALNRKFYRFSLGGMRDEAEIKGHRRTYIGAMPGKMIQILKLAGTSNPVIMLDEIDKIGASFQGDPASALLEVLDPEQNSQFLDHYIDVRYDLSNILFIATANQPDTIPLALLDRMELMNLSGYIAEEKIQITKRYLINKQLEAHGLKKDMVLFNTPAIKKIIDGYAREAGVRSLENSIKKIMRKAARKFAEGEKKTISITEKNIEEFLGKPRFIDESLYSKSIPGVVTGLAWTSMGGATLYVEATASTSKGRGFKQTGQLGAVMKESTEIAYTYISSNVDKYKLDKEYFENHLIHLHVPAGATPKDGPSAGITMATALYSLVKNKPVKQQIAMTGELTITGKVLPIGGVKEKTIAAKRANVKTIIYPFENKKDYEELPAYIKKGLKARFVNYFEEVLDIVY